MTNMAKMILSSPLLNRNGIPDDLRVVKETVEKLSPLFSEMDRLGHAEDRPLNVAVFGEVKAGKSTLVNALVGRRIAPTDVTEATSAVTVFRHAKEPYGAVFFSDGSMQKESIEVTSSQLDEKQKNRDQEYFAKVSHIEFGIDFKELELIRLIDTPGLASVTHENHARAMEFSRDCDCVLWVFPGDALGNEQSRDAILQQAKEGKGKIAAVVNVYGMETIGDATREKDLERFILRHVGRPHLKGGVFVVDCKAAQEGRVGHDEVLTERSGFLALQEWLRSGVFEVAEDVKRESSREKELSLASRILLHHLDFAQDLKFIITQLDMQAREVENNKARIEEIVITRLRHKVVSILRIDDWRQRMEYVKVNPKKRLLDDVYKDIKAHFTKENMEKQAQTAIRSVEEKLQEEWKIVFEKLKKLLVDNLDQYRMEKTTFLEAQLKTIDGSLGALGYGSLAGASVGGLALISLGGWVAWFGPYAASISFAQGLGLAALFPPVIIIGAIATGAGALYGYKQLQNKIKSAIDQLSTELDNAERKFQQILRNEIEPALREANEGCASFVFKVFEKELVGELGREGAKSLLARITDYIDELKIAIETVQA